MNPTYFRNRPMTVEARQVHSGDLAQAREIATWCGGDLLDPGDLAEDGIDLAVIYVPDTNGAVPTEDGSYADEGDWVVRYQTGEFRVYTDQVFRANFDPVVFL